MPNIRRGAAAIEAAAERKGGGDFAPFCPSIRWTENGQEKYVLVLTPIDKTPTINLHEFIQIGTRENGKPIFGFYASRKDPGIGESYDLITDEFGKNPSEKTLGVAVELEPEYESNASSRRPRIKRFKVATDTYDRKNEDGTTEEVTFPLIGVVSQASKNFYNHIRSNDQDYGPIEELPLKIKRIGTSTDTQYSFTPFMDQEIDLANLIEYIENVGYVDDDVAKEAQDLDPDAAAQLIASNILDKRIAELTDKEAYDAGVGPVTEIKGYKEVFYRNGNGNGHVAGGEQGTDEDLEESEVEEDQDAAFKRIKRRAEAKTGR